jgi:hypothetical protein
VPVARRLRRRRVPSARRRALDARDAHGDRGRAQRARARARACISTTRDTSTPSTGCSFRSR